MTQPETRKSAANRTRLQQGLLIAATLLILGLLARYILQNKEMLSALSNLNFGTILLSLGLYLISLGTDSLYTKFAAEAVGIKLDITDWLGVSAVGGVIGTVIPFRSSTIFKGVYYKAKCNMAYSRFLSLMAGGIVFVAVCGALEIVAGLLLLGLGDSMSAVLLMCAVLILALLALLVFILVRKKSFVERVLPLKKYTMPAYEGFLQIVSQKKTCTKCLLTTLATVLLNAVNLFVIARGLGGGASLGAAMLYNGVITPVNLLSILPGNIGVQEMLIGWLASVTGGAFNSGVLLSLVQRVLVLARYLVVATLFIIPVYRRIRAIPAKKNQEESEL